MNVCITMNAQKLYVTSPYNSEFVTGAKLFHGIWKNPCWVFDHHYEEQVRKLCRDVYGTDGSNAPDIVTIQARFSPASNKDKAAIEVFGWTVARAWGRDTGIILGKGVVLLKGGFRSGGSIKNWQTQAEEDTEVLIPNIPRHKAETAIKKGEKWLTIDQINDAGPVVRKRSAF